MNQVETRSLSTTIKESASKRRWTIDLASRVMDPFLLSSDTLGLEDFGPVTLRCPACRHNGSFQPTADGKHDFHDPPQHRAFLSRRCPNPNCRAHLFVVVSIEKSKIAEVLDSYPVEAYEFDSTAIPRVIVETFEEALLCHQVGADTAAAMMIRRTLEELCQDRGATGDNLKQRIGVLGKQITVPQELLDAAEELRLLGNDAAHIEARDFAEIGNEELEVAIEFTKDLLRSTYQMADLLSRLRKLKEKKTHSEETPADLG